MTAAQVIEQIKTLPPQEKAAVVDFVQHLAGSDLAQERTPADQANLEGASDKILDRYDNLFRKLAK